MQKTILIILLPLLAAAAGIFIALELYRKPLYISHFEAQEYAVEEAFMEPVLVEDGLAVYAVGDGKPVLLFPYPHGHTTHPMAQSPIAEVLVESGYRVISFDVPGAYQSTRKPVGDIQEMIACAEETLDRLGIQEPIPVIGHSMGGLAALGFTIERPERVNQLVLVTSLSGFPAAARWGLPGSTFRLWDPDFWRIILWGMKLNAGRGSLALHKQLQNLMGVTSFHKVDLFTPVQIEPDDAQKGVPIRTIWSKNMYARLSYADRLDEVRVPALILAGRHDPEAPLECSRELFNGIPEARLFVFEESGHSPFIEEPALFQHILRDFLWETKVIP